MDFSAMSWTKVWWCSQSTV